ncbi:uncharacterized protein BX664DRAFT_325462 [Halteromyces radiatus]|uniref:uncharacterized protein n=1 Tax=Halteromyces radiatus TaxID=101107 RepID=UPI00221FCB83|nr:uncharacterized protein BX664DRAFT_325462 [Halteromyces radiatus]KAI8097044.1 hypothetical protein BX664DRAFT_325462 [Halteromyces radiatus]
MIILYHSITLFFFILFTFLQIINCQMTCDVTGPQGFSDFSLLQIDSTLYLTGGNPTSTDVWSLDLGSGIDITQCLPWHDIQSTNNNDTTIQPFMYGVAFNTPDNQLFAQTGDGGTSTMANGIKLDLTTNTWTNVNSQGQIPVVRAEMTVSLNRTTNQVWYYGGRNTQNQQASGNFNYYNDFYFLDTTTNTWNWPTIYNTGGIRPSRFGHTSNLLMGQIFILGGKTAIMNGSDNTWIVENADFRSVLVFDTIANTSISMATINDIPPGLVRFSATNAPDGRSIVIFGGKTLNKHTFIPTQNVYVLDTCTLSWSVPNIQGTPPTARAGHEAITVGNYMIVIGGITNVANGNTISYANDVAILDMTTWTWVNSIPAGNYAPQQPVNPGCRFSMPVSQNDNNSGNGGSDGSGLPYDSTVVSNPNLNNNIALKEGLGIGLGTLGLLLCGGIIYFIRRMRQQARTISPRWLPTILTRSSSSAKKSTSSSTRSSPSTSSSLPSTASDTKDDIIKKKNDVPLFVITEHP